MEPKLCILVSAFFRREVERCCEVDGDIFGSISFRFFWPKGPRLPEQDESSCLSAVFKQCFEEFDSLYLLSGHEALAQSLVQPAGKDVRVCSLPHCFSLVADPFLIHSCRQQGGCLFTPGSLRYWQDRLQGEEYPQALIPCYPFPSLPSRLFLLDTGVDETSVPSMRQMASMFGVFWERIPVGFHLLRCLLRNLVLEWRLALSGQVSPPGYARRHRSRNGGVVAGDSALLGPAYAEDGGAYAISLPLAHSLYSSDSWYQQSHQPPDEALSPVSVSSVHGNPPSQQTMGSSLLSSSSSSSAQTLQPLPAPDVVDFSVMEQFQDGMGDEGQQIVREIVLLYLESAPRLFDAMRQSLAQNNQEVFTRSAHSLKSSSAQVGAMGLSALCKEMEEQGRAGILEGADQRVQDAERLYQQVRDALVTMEKG